jgi:hypothetical protein
VVLDAVREGGWREVVHGVLGEGQHEVQVFAGKGGDGLDGHRDDGGAFRLGGGKAQDGGRGLGEAHGGRLLVGGARGLEGLGRVGERLER